MSNFDDFAWDARQEGESYEEYKKRRKEEQDNIDYYLKGRRIKDGKGQNRHKYLMKKKRRNTLDEVRRK